MSARRVRSNAIGIATGYAALTLHGRGEDGTPTKVLLGIAYFCGFLLVVSSIFIRPEPPALIAGASLSDALPDRVEL